MLTEARKRAPALTYPTIRSAASKVEGQHVRDRIGAQHRHQQAIHAQRDAGAARQSVRQCGEQVLVDRRRLQAAALPDHEVALEARRSEENKSELQSLMRTSY